MINRYLRGLAVALLAATLAPAWAHPPVEPTLDAHTQEFEKRVYKVTDGVYQAVGYAIANSIMIEGDDGIIIVDVTESLESAQEVMAEFRKITDKPVKALIYTHNHADHVFGARGFVPEGDVDVYAHETTNYYINRAGNIIANSLQIRSSRMFGTYLPQGEEGVVNTGLGPFLAVTGPKGGTVAPIRPNKTFSDELDIEIAGVKIKLVHAPGETNDQLFVWLPEKKVLMPGDNLYKAFPNLYTIRGTLYRDVLGWVDSLDKMLAVEPEFIAPSHSRPIAGKDQVKEVLTVYRDAIQYVHDQTVRGINQGLTPDELVEVVKLPPHLKNHPYLAEHYGTVAWSVRMIYQGYLGWFDGDATTLNPVGPVDRAQKTVALMGGEQKVEQSIRDALADKEWAWAAELAAHLERVAADNTAASELKAQALRNLGQLSVSANGRNYYLTQALETENQLAIKPEDVDENRLDFVKTLPMVDLLKSMPVNLNPEKAVDVDQRVELNFTDSGESFNFHVRNGVAVLREGKAEGEVDLRVELTAAGWVEMITGHQSLPKAMLTGDIKLENRITDIPAFLGFLNLFAG